MVEPQIVILVVAGSSPVDHPIFPIGISSGIRAGEEEIKPERPMQPLESRIHYKFRNSLLLAEALTHPSLAYESQKPHFDNQRLEFLGDAVLQLIVTEELFKMFPDFTEGRLTKLRSRVVSRRALARFAMAIHLGDYVLLGKGEEATGGRRRLSTLADAFESLIGAVYLDSGPEPARELVLRLVRIRNRQHGHQPRGAESEGRAAGIPASDPPAGAGLSGHRRERAGPPARVPGRGFMAGHWCSPPARARARRKRKPGPPPKRCASRLWEG